MEVRGWIYILSNRAMPGLIKIDYSLKDPALRAKELQGTGLPHSFVVEYDALVLRPKEIEQAVHKNLAGHHESKEFFRIDIAAAISEIKKVASEQGKPLITEKGGVECLPSNTIESNKDRCAICGLINLPTDSRCRNCFALLQ